MKEYVVHLIPQSSFETSLNSDTIFGAICWGIRTLYGESMLLSVIKDFEIRPPFIISSAFPCKIMEQSAIYYLPKPILRPLTSSDLDKLAEMPSYRHNKEIYHSDKIFMIDMVNKYKKFKKLQWVPISIFKKVMKNVSENDLFHDYLDELITETKYVSSGATQKNSIDRLTASTSGSGNVFYTSESHFRENKCLYFLIRTDDLDSYLRPVLRYLEDSGVGPNARTGKNWFKIDVDNTPMFDRAGTGSFVTLSRYIGLDSINTEKSYYKTTSIRSKVESRLEFAGQDIWKNRVTYFSEGSLLTPKLNKDFYGSLTPVKKISEKTIFQYGYAYPVWVKGGGPGEI